MHQFRVANSRLTLVAALVGLSACSPHPTALAVDESRCWNLSPGHRADTAVLEVKVLRIGRSELKFRSDNCPSLRFQPQFQSDAVRDKLAKAPSDGLQGISATVEIKRADPEHLNNSDVGVIDVIDSRVLNQRQTDILYGRLLQDQLYRQKTDGKNIKQI